MIECSNSALEWILINHDYTLIYFSISCIYANGIRNFFPFIKGLVGFGFGIKGFFGSFGGNKGFFGFSGRRGFLGSCNFSFCAIIVVIKLVKNLDI
jgi:hypothetical protein